MPTCYRHPGEPAGIVCQRCDRPICPKCMHQASVGFHCPECVKAGKQQVISGPGAFGIVRPLLTQVLIGINVAVFAIGMVVERSNVLGGDVSGSFHEKLALVAHVWVRGNTLFDGPAPGTQEIGVGAGEWYRLVTSGFLHYGIFHLAVNMYALWILGTVTERLAGRLRFGIVYGVSLLAGSLGALLLSPDGFTAGASGAIFGLMGALFIAERAAGIPFRSSGLLPVLVLNLVITFGIPGISIGGHLGGLVGGAISGWVLFDLARRPNIDRRVPYAICGALALACVVGAIVFASGYQPSFA